jgi:hypothetical protein
MVYRMVPVVVEKVLGLRWCILAVVVEEVVVGWRVARPLV